jgi:hypothetical protein
MQFTFSRNKIHYSLGRIIQFIGSLLTVLPSFEVYEKFLSWRKVNALLLYWMQNICKLNLCQSKGGREGGKGKGEQDALCAIASPPSLPVPRLATNMCVCNSQRSLEISCDKYTIYLVNNMPVNISCSSWISSWLACFYLSSKRHSLEY